MWYWIKTNRIIKKIFPKYVWEIPTTEKTVYLTFDDGPTPEITDWILDQLKQFDARATFFCIGENIRKHPEIFQRMRQNGHAFGNHTFNHYNGWKTDTKTYLSNIERCSETIREITPETTTLFRPPYGKIRKSQAAQLLSDGYQIIMWDVLSADFDTAISPEKCLKNVLKNVRPGSIIVFHDSVKAWKNLEYALPGTLQFLKANQFKCEGIFKSVPEPSR